MASFMSLYLASTEKSDLSFAIDEEYYFLNLGLWHGENGERKRFEVCEENARPRVSECGCF